MICVGLRDQRAQLALTNKSTRAQFWPLVDRRTQVRRRKFLIASDLLAIVVGCAASLVGLRFPEQIIDSLADPPNPGYATAYICLGGRASERMRQSALMLRVGGSWK